MKIDTFLLVWGSSSLVCLLPSPPSITVLLWGFLSPTFNSAFAPFFCRILRGRPGLCRSPLCGDDRRPACSFPDDTLQREGSADITAPAASAPSPPDNPEPLNVLPPSGCIFARTRRRTAAAAGTALPAVDYGFRPGGAPRPPIRRDITPPQAPRPRSPVPVVMAPTPAASPVPTIPIPSDHDRAEPVGTPLLGLPPPTGAPPVATTDVDTLRAAAEFQFGGSGARYSHADWARKQQAEPSCNAAMRCIALGRPEACPSSFRRVSLPISALPYRRFGRWLTKANCIPPTRASSFSSDSRPPSLTSGRQRPVGRAACLY